MIQAEESSKVIQELEEVFCDTIPDNGSKFKVFLYDPARYGNPLTENILSWSGHSVTSADVREMSLKNYLDPFVSQVPEYGVTEKVKVWRWLHFRNRLEEMLDSIKVFSIYDTDSESIIIGETKGGICAGLRCSVNF